MAILLIDNYDSFTYNLAHLFGELGAEVVVRRNDAITADEAEALVHGKATTVRHDGRGVFTGLAQDFPAGRYHSLAATSIPDGLEVSATAPDGEVMAVRHRELPVDGVQFHPESVLTPVGRDLARNFLGAA